jgi:pyrroloquinoline quinone biosynthesis protein B
MLLVAPDVAAITPELRDAMQRAAVVLFDGTFWREDELRMIDPGARLASEMGHLAIADGSLPILRALPGRKILLHINNTNPVLQPGSTERAELHAAGIQVPEDGLEFGLPA